MPNRYPFSHKTFHELVCYGEEGDFCIEFFSRACQISTLTEVTKGPGARRESVRVKRTAVSPVHGWRKRVLVEYDSMYVKMRPRGKWREEGERFMPGNMYDLSFTSSTREEFVKGTRDAGVSLAQEKHEWWMSRPGK